MKQGTIIIALLLWLIFNPSHACAVKMSVECQNKIGQDIFCDKFAEWGITDTALFKTADKKLYYYEFDLYNNYRKTYIGVK